MGKGRVIKMEKKVQKEKIKEETRKFIFKNFMHAKGTLKDEDSLFESNIMDSFGILELSSFIEKKFGVAINPSDVTIEHFDSVDKIVKFIINKMK